MGKNYNRLAIAIIAAALIIVAGITASSYYLGPTRTSTRTVTSTVTACDTQYSPSIVRGVNSYSSYLVFATNSTAWLCAILFNENNDTVALRSPLVWQLLQNGTWAHSTANLNVTTTPGPSQLAPNSNDWYVFEIVPRNGTQDIFNVLLPGAGCWTSVIVAVGYSITQLQHTRLDLPADYGLCVGGDAVLDKVSGITNLIPTYTE